MQGLGAMDPPPSYDPPPPHASDGAAGRVSAAGSAARHSSPHALDSARKAEMRRMLQSDNVFNIGGAEPPAAPAGTISAAGRRPRLESGDRLRAANASAMAEVAARSASPPPPPPPLHSLPRARCACQLSSVTSARVQPERRQRECWRWGGHDLGAVRRPAAEVPDASRVGADRSDSYA